MDEKTVKAAEAVLARGRRVLIVPVKDGHRVFEVDQKEVKIANPKREH